MKRIVLPSVNDCPMIEAVRRDDGRIFRRALLPDGEEYIDGGSEWREATQEDLRAWQSVGSPLAALLHE